MSDQMPHDEELRAAYRRLPADEPRAEIDDAILAAARRRSEVDARRTLLRRIRWAVPLAAAAGVVLTMTLTRLTPQHDAVVQPGVGLDESAPAPAAAPMPAPAEEAAGSDAVDSLARREAAGDDRANRDRAQVVEGEAKKAEAVKPSPERREAAEADAARPAAPPPSSIGAMSAPRAAEPAPQPGTAPSDAAKSSGAQGSLGYMDGGHEAPLNDLAVTEESPGDAAAFAEQESDEWPFALEPGLGATEACRRLVLAVGDRCEFKGNTAVVFPEAGTIVDLGKFKGRRATRITLTLRNGELWSVGLKVNSYREEQVLLPPKKK